MRLRSNIKLDIGVCASAVVKVHNYLPACIYCITAGRRTPVVLIRVHIASEPADSSSSMHPMQSHCQLCDVVSDLSHHHCPRYRDIELPLKPAILQCRMNWQLADPDPQVRIPHPESSRCTTIAPRFIAGRLRAQSLEKFGRVEPHQKLELRRSRSQIQSDQTNALGTNPDSEPLIFFPLRTSQ